MTTKMVLFSAHAHYRFRRPCPTKIRFQASERHAPLLLVLTISRSWRVAFLRARRAEKQSQRHGERAELQCTRRMHGSAPQVRFPLFHQHHCLGTLWAENTSGDSESAASWPKRHHRAGSRQELSGTIAQCLKLEQEIHDSASKLCILGFEPLK